MTVCIPGSMTLEIGTLNLETAIMGKLGYHEADANALLGSPEDIATACLIPLSYTRPRAGTSVAYPHPQSRLHPR